MTVIIIVNFVDCCDQIYFLSLTFGQVSCRGETALGFLVRECCCWVVEIKVALRVLLLDRGGDLAHAVVMRPSGAGNEIGLGINFKLLVHYLHTSKIVLIALV